MAAALDGATVRRLVLVPAIVTLAVTLLRLAGELLGGSSLFFNRAPGGGGAVVGIVWLVPVFGTWFALRLRRDGYGPPRRRSAIGWAVAGLAVFALLMFGATQVLGSTVQRVIAINVAAVVGALVAARGWPALAQVLLVYGLAARIPVVVIMLVAMLASWGTHYEFGPPDLPPMAVLPKWLLVGLLPQMCFWIFFTIAVGMLAGALAALFQKIDARSA